MRQDLHSLTSDKQITRFWSEKAVTLYTWYLQLLSEVENRFRSGWSLSVDGRVYTLIIITYGGNWFPRKRETPFQQILESLMVLISSSSQSGGIAAF